MPSGESYLLLVGAQRDALKITQILLEKEGYGVIAAVKPAEAVLEVARNAETIRLCILDLSKITAPEPLYAALADDMDSEIDDSAETKQDGAIDDNSIPILFIAQSEQEGEEAVAAAGLMAEFIVKPYDKSDLLDKVKKFSGK
jgi:CheY-like chemotaxis protein